MQNFHKIGTSYPSLVAAGVSFQHLSWYNSTFITGETDREMEGLVKIECCANNCSVTFKKTKKQQKKTQETVEFDPISFFSYHCGAFLLTFYKLYQVQVQIQTFDWKFNVNMPMLLQDCWRITTLFGFKLSCRLHH